MAMTQGFYPESPNVDLQYITYGRYLNKKGIVEKYPSMENSICYQKIRAKGHNEIKISEIIIRHLKDWWYHYIRREHAMIIDTGRYKVMIVEHPQEELSSNCHTLKFPNFRM
jgi:heterodisulfide reductase subunit A-like polyferredoxin